MPCKECKEGKVKWGESGECQYDSIAECEEAHKDYYENLKTTSIVELVIDDECLVKMNFLIEKGVDISNERIEYRVWKSI